MKKISIFFILISLIISVGCQKEATEMETTSIENELSTADQAILAIVESTNIPISATPLTNSDQSLAILDQLADKRIVGLGEATHGTKEFFQMKQRIFQYLVENHGFTAFVFEMDLAEARFFNDWVQWRSEEDITQLMRTRMLFWTWHTTEVRGLLQYMRDYNQGKQETDMLGIYGVDAQFPNYDLTQLVDILKKSGVAQADEVLSINQKYSMIIELYQNDRTDVLVGNIIKDINFTKKVVADNEALIVETQGKAAFLWAQQLALHMDQVQRFTYDFYQNERSYQRDQFMADNTRWLFDLLGENTKMVLWAHNGHIANDQTYAAPWGGSQGSYLKEIYGDAYQALGFSFGKGAFSAVQSNGTLGTQQIVGDPIPGSTTHLLYQAKTANYILPLNNQGSNFDGWSFKERPFLMVGSVYNGNPSRNYRLTRLGVHYDYLIHFDATTNSELLPR